MKLEALARGTGHESLRRYFTSSPDLPEVLELKELTFKSPEYATPQYLIGRQLFQRRDYGGAVQYLRKAFDAGIPDLEVRRESLRVLAQAAYFDGDFAGTRRALTPALSGQHIDAQHAAQFADGGFLLRHRPLHGFQGGGLVGHLPFQGLEPVRRRQLLGRCLGAGKAVQL